MKSRLLALSAAVVVLLASGLVHGVWTERWHTSPALQDACLRVAETPTTAGHWNGANVDVDPAPYQQARAAGYWLRRYTKDGVNRSMTVILMCGRADHMSLHTPDVCYRGAGYEVVDGQSKIAVTLPKNQTKAKLWSARFRQPTASIDRELKILWSWNCGDGWQAPAFPRWTFGASPFLYKLYVAYDNDQNDELTADFLGELLPALDRSLFGPASLQGSRQQGP